MKKKNIINVFPIFTLGIILFLYSSCYKENEVPTLTTLPVIDITQTTANCGGNITSQGDAPITVKGVCWGISPNPTIEDTKTNNGTSSGSFTSSMSYLLDSTKYFVRAFATNKFGTGYGEVMSFTTLSKDERDIYTGEWKLIESFKSSLNQTYIVKIIIDPSNSRQIIIGNLGNPGSQDITVKGIATSSQVVVSSQSMGNGWLIEGAGHFSNVSKTTMAWTYTITAGGNKDEYTATATLQ